jgi:oxygen-dependent protoporphyrinogen oxidase
MIRALVSTLPSGSVQTNTAVTRISRNERGAGFRAETTGGIAFECRALVLSTPAYVTAALVHSEDADLARLCAEIPYSSIATVALAFSRKDVAHPLNGSGYVVPRTEGSGILAATWLSSKWPPRAPEGKVLLRTFIGGARDPGALAQSDAELVARSLAAVRSVLRIGGDPLFTRVYRFDRASAQHEVGHLDRITTIDRRLGAHPGLFVTGSGFRGVGIPDCIADARATAAKVAEWMKSTTTEGTEKEQRAR